MKKPDGFFMRVLRWAFKLTPFRISLLLMLLFLFLYVQMQKSLAIVEADIAKARFKSLALLESKAYDIRFQALNRFFQDRFKPSEHVVIVETDERSLDHLGWPFPRDRWGDFIRRMHEYGAEVVAFDIVFETPGEYVGLKFLKDSLAQYKALGLDKLPKKLLGSKDKEMREYRDNAARFVEYMRNKEEQADLDADFGKALKEVQEDMDVVLGWYGWRKEGEIASLQDQDFSDNVELIMPSNLPPQVSKKWSPDFHSLERVWRRFWTVRVLGLQTNIPALSENTDHFGFFTAIPDTLDGTIRRTPLITIFSLEPENPNFDNTFIFPSLSIASVSAWFDEKPVVKITDLGAMIIFKNVQIPTDQYGRLLINWMGKERTFPYYSIYDVLTGFKQRPDIEPKKAFKGKIVLVGSTAVGAHDLRITPFGTSPGVEMHANVISNILKGDTLIKPDWFKAFDMLFIIVVAVIFGLVLPRLSAILGGVVTLVLFLGYLGFNIYLFVFHHYSFTIVFPLAELVLIYIGITIFRYATEEREKRYIKKAFEFYLSPHVIDELMKDPGKLKLGGERRVCTAFFSDIQSFSTFSEKMEPEELVHFLNEYLTEICDIILKHDGVVDKFEGDAIIAFFGAPLDLPDHAARACLCAAEIQKCMVALREKWAKDGLPEVHMRIGLNTGPMVVGNMGSAHRMDYTMMGDSVNLAARLEEGAKRYGMYTLISNDTYEGAKDAVEVRDLHLFQVVGKEEAVHVYEIIGKKGEVDPEKMKVVDLFHQGLELYKQRKFRDARDVFQNIVDTDHKDGPSMTFVQLCEKYIQAPPGEDWDQVYVWASKDE